MKNKLWLLCPVLALLLAFSLVVPANADDPVPLPHNFYGSLTIGTEPAPAETEVEARGEGVMTTEANPITTTEEGQYGGPGPLDPKLEVQGYIDDGTPIEFYVDGAKAQCREHGTETWLDSYPWRTDGKTELDLRVGVPAQYDLTVASTDGGSVTTPGEPGPFTYDAGTMVDLVAVPDTGYEFVNWTGDVGTVADVNAASTTITMNGDYTITANFAEVAITYSLTVGSTVGGSVTEPGEGTFEPYDPETVVNLLAVPDEGYQFLSWTGDVGTIADINAASTTITMNGNYTIQANFGEIGVTYDLTVASTAGGSVTDPGEGTFLDYPAGTPVTLLAVADAGYRFVNWTGDVSTIAKVNAASTTITMNGDYSITANFAKVTGDLGELIAGTPAGETLTLPAGTYTGNAIIDKPITIRGTVGTIISGGITIAELTGSNVTIEYLTITDYIDFGIRIVKVRAEDTFMIRNNTIQGVEGSLIGIEVVEVEAGGSLEFLQNSISGNEVGIKLREAVAWACIAFNNIVGNEVGLELLVVGEHGVGAQRNWWGDISGPEEENNNPGGIGDKIELVDGLMYYPWLTRDFQTVLDDNIAYFGFPMVWLDTGWNIISTPIALDPLVEWVDSEGISRTGVNTWGNYVALGDGLDVHATSPAYSFNSQTQGWVQLTSSYTLKPCDAIYVRMASVDKAAILFSPNVSVPSKRLNAGWNLVGLAWLPTGRDAVYGLPANEALVTVEEVTGGLIGYKLVVSPGVNDYERSWIYIAGRSIEPWTDPDQCPDGWMMPTSGYWVFMLNDGTLAGFTFTPVRLGL